MAAHGAIPSFSDSRRLFGPTPWLDKPGVLLEGHAPSESAEALGVAWRAIATAMITAVGWPVGDVVVRRRAGHLILGFTAPGAVLLTATELNEWAWEEAVRALGLPLDPPMLMPAALPRDTARATLQLGVWADLERLAPTSDLAITPPAGQHVAVVTGSNGKTTTTRLIAAMTRAQGWSTGWNCTDGVFFDGVAVEVGDWSGPAGAQRVVTGPEIAAAVLETARGGILRRGLGVIGTDVAVVTNIESDHFGEYGVQSLADLAEAKLVIAKGLRAGGVLVLNADDPTLSERTPPPGIDVVWFSAAGASYAAARRDGEHLFLTVGEEEFNLGTVAEMPLTVSGAAAYNIANALAAALAAQRLGVAPETIATVLANFGNRIEDNAGRLMQFSFGGVRVLVDYAHNPAGLAGLLTVARGLRPRRLLLLLGQAGNRTDEDLVALAGAAWEARPDRIILKELEEYRRGRAVGEVPALMEQALLALGASREGLEVVLGEVAAVEAALDWAEPGDLLVLPVHDLAARAEVITLLQARTTA